MSKSNNLSIHWIDRERNPENPPNPQFPDGVDIDQSQGFPCCEQRLPYPAPRCGFFYVECRECGTNTMISTAGRRDDPRSVKLRCRKPVVMQ